MNDIVELQAQVIALRMAVEGAWLSLMNADPAALQNAARMRRENVDAVEQLDASNAEALALRDAVSKHTEQLWRSIEWQLQQLRVEAGKQ